MTEEKMSTGQGLKMGAAEKISFELTEQNSNAVLKFSGPLDAGGADSFRDSIPSLLEKDIKALVIHCDGLTHLPPPWVRALMALHQKFKPLNREIRVTGVGRAFGNFLKAEGLDTCLKSATPDPAAKKKTVDVAFINPFLDATIKTLEVQCMTVPRAGKIYVKDVNETFAGDISGVIGLVSDAFTGSVVISFPKETFLGVMSRMLGEELKELNKDIEDGAAEMTNIIFGQAKVVLNEKGYGIKTALPSVITGQGHSIHQSASGQRIVIPFETDVGPFFVEICVSN